MDGYSAREAARLLGLSEAQLRAWVRAGLVAPERGPRGEHRFSFRDLVLLKSAKGLASARVPARRVREALARLGAQLPAGTPISAVQVYAEGEELVARSEEATWAPASGQVLFEFGAPGEGAEIAAFTPIHRAPPPGPSEEEMGAEDWFLLGADLEAVAPAQARDAYRRALELEPHHADAHFALGRLLAEAGLWSAAVAHHRLAADAQPDDPLITFHLGLALEAVGALEAALTAQSRVVALEPGLRDAHLALARLFHLLGDEEQAARALARHRALDEPGP